MQKRECNLLIDTLYTILGAMKTTFEPFLSLFLFLMTFGLLIFENCSRKECLLIRYTVIKPEVINLLEEISWCEFPVLFIRLLILLNLLQSTWLVAYAICQWCNKAIFIQHIIEIIINKFHSFFLVFFQASSVFLQDTFSSIPGVI